MNAPLLEIRHLTKSFFNQQQEHVVLKDFSLNVEKNEFLCILGPSGCGKTTLLRCIAGFESYAGDIAVAGEKKKGPGSDRIMVFQDFNQLFPWKTIEQNVQYPLNIQGIKNRALVNELVFESLKKVRLEQYANYYPHQLSGGMKQRVSIAKAIALKPKIILMDEPFAALDAMTRRQLQAEMNAISEDEGCTVIFITHNIQEAIILGTRILVLAKGGSVVFDEKNVISKPVTPASAEYGALWQTLYSALYV